MKDDRAGSRTARLSRPQNVRFSVNVGFAQIAHALPQNVIDAILFDYFYCWCANARQLERAERVGPQLL